MRCRRVSCARIRRSTGSTRRRLSARGSIESSRTRHSIWLAESIPATFRDPAVSGELRERLEAALAQLPDRARAVIVMHDIEGFTHAEIGEMLSIPGGTARSDLHHARQKLRVLLGNLRD